MSSYISLCNQIMSNSVAIRVTTGFLKINGKERGFDQQIILIFCRWMMWILLLWKGKFSTIVPEIR